MLVRICLKPPEFHGVTYVTQLNAPHYIKVKTEENLPSWDVLDRYTAASAISSMGPIRDLTSLDGAKSSLNPPPWFFPTQNMSIFLGTTVIRSTPNFTKQMPVPIKSLSLNFVEQESKKQQIYNDHCIDQYHYDSNCQQTNLGALPQQRYRCR